MKKIYSLKTNKFIYFVCLLFLIGFSSIRTEAQTITLGTGTTASANTDPSPINGFYNYIRHQAIYTKAEINAAGITGPHLINSLAYYVTTAPAGGVPNWVLRVANTAQADCATHDADPLTTVYTNANPTWTVGAWNTLTFTTPYYWDGNSNLLVDVNLGLAPFTTPYGSLWTYPQTNGSRYIRCDACGSQAASVTATALAVKPQVQLNFSNAAACTGTPAPGNTLSSANPVCPTIGFTLSTQNAFPFSGITYVWQSSPDGITWTPIAGATSASLTTSQTVATYYRVLVTCGGNTGNSASLLVNVNSFVNCYCSSNATSTADEEILNVTYGTLNNTSTCTSLAPGPGSILNEYSNYTSGAGAPAAPNINAGVATAWSTQVGTCGGNYGNSTAMWIDIDHSGTFDANEKFYVSAAYTTGPHLESANITLPLSALPGLTRMRVVTVETTTPTSITACGTYSWGETEDYLINVVVGCVAGTFTTQPANTSILCTSNATFTVATTGTAVTIQWQESPNGGVSFANLTNNAVYSGVTTNTLTITGAPITMNGYLYRAFLNGTCTPANFLSNSATLTVTQPAAPAVSTPNPIVCAGGIVALTLAPTSNIATFSSGTISVPIPDNSLAGATHTIAVSAIPAGAIITNFTVALNITHTWVGDLVIALKAPNASILNLDYYLTSTGGAGPTSGFTNTRISATGVAALNTGTNPYNAIFKPDAQLTAPFGPTGPTGYSATVNNFPALYSTLNGNWTLAMYDGGAGDFGPLTSWSITINYGFNQTGIWTPSAGLFTDAAATIPYTGTLVNTVYAKPLVATTYSVTISQGACTSPATLVPITVNTPVSISTQPIAAAVCAGSNTSFSVTAAGTAPTYQWQVSTDNGLTWNNIGGANSNSYAVIAATNAMNGNKFRVVVSGAAPCGSVTSNAVNLTVNALPTVTISASPRTKLIPTTTTTLTATVVPAGTGTFKWYRNGVQVPGVSTNSLVADIDHIGDYSAIVTDANGCTSFLSNIVTISDTASGKLYLYPNPNRGKFHVRFYTTFYTPNALPPAGVSSIEVRYISVYDMVGQRILDKPFSVYAPYGSMDVDLTPFGKGVYLIMVKDVQGKKLAEGRAVVQ